MAKLGIIPVFNGTPTHGRATDKRAHGFHFIEGYENRKDLFIYRVVAQKAGRVLKNYPGQPELLEDPDISGLSKKVQTAIRAAGWSLASAIRKASQDYVDEAARVEQEARDNNPRLDPDYPEIHRLAVALADLIRLGKDETVEDIPIKMRKMLEKNLPKTLALLTNWDSKNGRDTGDQGRILIRKKKTKVVKPSRSVGAKAR